MSKLPNNSPSVFKTQNIKCYIEKPNTQLSVETSVFKILIYYSHAECIAYYTPKEKSSKTSEYKQDELNSNLTENNHEVCSKLL